MPLMRSGFPFFSAILLLLCVAVFFSLCRAIFRQREMKKMEKKKCLILWIPWIWIFACAVGVCAFRWQQIGQMVKMASMEMNILGCPKNCTIISFSRSFTLRACLCLFLTHRKLAVDWFRSFCMANALWPLVLFHLWAHFVWRHNKVVAQFCVVSVLFFFLSVSVSSVSVKHTAKMIRRAKKHEVEKQKYLRMKHERNEKRTPALWFVCRSFFIVVFAFIWKFVPCALRTPMNEMRWTKTEWKKKIKQKSSYISATDWLIAIPIQLMWDH